MDEFTILGERRSGTFYLQRLIEHNFEIKPTWQYGWKHFFGFNDYGGSNNVLFLGIVRNPKEWILSLYNNPFHLNKEMSGKGLDHFMLAEFWSIKDDHTPQIKGILGNEIMADRNMHTLERYTNLFEARKVKCNYLINIFPNVVENYHLIRLEDLETDYLKVLVGLERRFKLKRKGKELSNLLTINGREDLPLYKKRETLLPSQSQSIIKNNLDMDIETPLNYDIL